MKDVQTEKSSPSTYHKSMSYISIFREIKCEEKTRVIIFHKLNIKNNRYNYYLLQYKHPEEKNEGRKKEGKTQMLKSNKGKRFQCRRKKLNEILYGK